MSELHQLFCTSYLRPTLGPPPAAFNTLCISGFADDVMLGHNGQEVMRKEA